jgi:hypothetical protein
MRSQQVLNLSGIQCIIVAGYIEQLGSKCVEGGVVGKFNDLEVAFGSGRVNLYSYSQEVGDCDNLGVVAFHINCLHFSRAEGGNITHEILK